jgi:aryl-alcohol dehydrogenase-like predicted oxidoreductase
MGRRKFHYPKMTKALVLGTAQWGWSVDRATAFQLLDHWLQSGFKEVDAATNYPINQSFSDFRLGEKILAEYKNAAKLDNDFQITMKVGSMDNMRSPDHNLSPSFLWMMTHEYRRVFGNCLGGIMVHWDNRNSEAEVEETMLFLQEIAQQGLRPGVSGLRHPEVHAAINARLQLALDVEIKHNPFASDLERYQPLLAHQMGKHRVLAYGTAAGGLKFKAHHKTSGTFELRGGQRENFEEKLAQIEARLPDLNLSFVRPPIVTLQQFGMAYALANPAIGGIIVAPRNVAQLKEAIEWHKNLSHFDYSNVLQVFGRGGLRM